MGLLMTLAGIAWFGRNLDWFDSALAEHASELSLNLFLALVAHQLVVFPEGTARSRQERLLVLAIYALAVLAYGPSEVSETANAVLSAVGIALAVLVLFVVVRRWLEAERPERRALRPLIVLGPPRPGRRGRVARARLHRHRPLLDGRGGAPVVRARLCRAAGRVPGRSARTHLRRAILGRLLADASATEPHTRTPRSRKPPPPRAGRCAMRRRCRASSSSHRASSKCSR